MPLMEISVVPIGTGSPSVSSYVAEVIKKLRERGTKYHLGPMGTVVEGSLDELLEIAKELHAV
ncbi:MAG: MTH1187 family thiamine-binding protein, partial [Candidatus Hydrothermia bacterium]